MMRSLWHDTVLGAYSPKDGYINLDYRNLFLDPLKADLTLFHEQVHRFLTKMTDFGQATSVIFQNAEALTKIKIEDLEKIRRALYQEQIFVQEGSATLMEALHLKSMKGAAAVRDWAAKSLPTDYRLRFNELSFVLDLPKEDQDRFTGIIPIYALHTIIRKRIAEFDLMRDAEKFVAYIKQADNNPDARFIKLIATVKKDPSLLRQPPVEICKAASVSFHADLSKHECAEFMTYLAQFTDEPRAYLPSDIGDAPDTMEHLIGASDEMVIGSFNMKNSMLLINPSDLLHYSDVVEAVVVFGLGEDKPWQKEYEQRVGVRPDGLVMAFQKTGEKYHIPLNREAVSDLLRNKFSAKTLIVKWGLYDVGAPELNEFPGSRRPDAVIYNTVKILSERVGPWLKAGHTAEYMFVRASENHPFQTLILKDEHGVLHYVNSFGNKLINDFKKEHKTQLVSRSQDDFLAEPVHLNNVLSIWMGLPWEVDWYRSITDRKSKKESLIFRA